MTRLSLSVVGLLLLLPGGAPGLVPYIILCVIVPEAPASGAKKARGKTTKKA